MSQAQFIQPLGSSFRDPSGFLFSKEGKLFRQVNKIYQGDYDHLMASGLLRELVEAGLLIPHREVDLEAPEPDKAYKIIQPEPVAFVSYPYEWCFSQLKNAALATLEIQKKALSRGMSLKDSSAYNIQFHNGSPVLIDTLSFEIYEEGRPWTPYRQFCQHFLAPLSLMAYCDVRLSQLLRVYIDGVPLDLASRLLPLRTKMVLPLLLHIHLHAASQRRYAAKNVNLSSQVSRTSLLGLMDSLETGVKKLRWIPEGTEWGDYSERQSYTETGLEHKQEIVKDYLERINPGSACDLGANVGNFSRLASERGIFTLAFDVDPGAVEKSYLESLSRRDTRLLPLVLDLTNPSPAIGWHNRERESWLERASADVVLALALIHHLVISNNVPLLHLASLLHQITRRWLIIEFIPKDDSQVQRLLSSRVDIFPDYNQEQFERVFSEFFLNHQAQRIRDSERSLYLLEKR